MLIVLVILGLVNSFFVTIHNIAIESDTTISVTLWNGLHQYGWNFLRDYRYSVDGWAFSIVPIHFLLFYLFGTSEHIIILGGWIIFASILFMLNICAKQAGVTLRSRLVCLVFLSFANVATIWFCGYLTYSICHNISILFFLIGYFFAIKYKNKTSIAAYIILNLLAAISDPWLSFAFILPMLASGAITFIVKKDNFYKNISIASGVCFIINVASVKTSVFGLFPYIVGTQPFEISIPIIANKIHFITRAYGYFFQFIPEKVAHKESQDGVILGFWIVAIICSAVKFIAEIKEKDEKEISLYLLFLMSVFSLILAQLMFAEVVADFSGRYIINIFLLTPFLLCIGQKCYTDKIIRCVTFAYLTFFIVTSIYSSNQFWNWNGYERSRPNAVTKALKAEGLSFGYGLYWDAMAPTVTWINNGNPTVRGVLFDNEKKMLTNRIGWQTNAIWYKPEDLKNQPQRQFLILKNTGYNDPCGDDKLAECGDDLTKQFGIPEKVSVIGDYTIFIWNHPLSPYFIN